MDRTGNAALATTPRWAPLAAFVERWYARPLDPDDGLDEAALRAIEARIGRALPVLAREWLALVGHRLQATNQDQPVRPEQVEIRDERLALWWEYQGNWSLDVEVGRDTSSAAIDAGLPEMPPRRAPIPEALLGMVVSDTMVAAWGGDAASLGALAAGVVGGFATEASEAISVRVTALAQAWSINPHYDALFGHDALLVRGSPGAWEWMAVGDAFREACEIFEVDPLGGPRHLELRFERVPASARGFVEAVIARDLERTLGARLGTARHAQSFASASIELETSEPDAVLARVVALLDDEGRAALRAVHRPPHVRRDVPLWPM